MKRHHLVRSWFVVGAVAILAALSLAAGSVQAAEIVTDGGELYRLEQGQVINDDLYVSAAEIIIDGTVDGDLIASGAYVEVNGVVTGDIWAVGASIVVNGVVEDDVRVAGAAVDIKGTVGSDLVAAAGGGGGFTFPFNVGAHSITPGLRIAADATIAQDALLAGGLVVVDGAIGRDLYVGANDLVLNGTVMGDAWLYAANLTVSDAAQVDGTLHHVAGESATIPATAASQVQTIPTQPSVADTPAPSPSTTIVNWLIGTLLLLVGFALLGWLLLHFAPHWLAEPTAAVAAKPGQAFIIGLVVFLLMIPVSALLVALTAVFWGIFPAGFAMLFFLFGILALLWVFSPMIPGLWIGRAISRGRWSDVLALLVGIVIIALAARLISLAPCTGSLVAFFIYLVCFSFTVGGFYVARQQKLATPAESAISEMPAPVE